MTGYRVTAWRCGGGDIGDLSAVSAQMSLEPAGRAVATSPKPYPHCTDKSAQRYDRNRIPANIENTRDHGLAAPSAVCIGGYVVLERKGFFCFFFLH